MSNFIKYAEGHWSVEGDVEVSLKKYLAMYEDVYNKTNLARILTEVPKGRALDILDYGGGVGMVSVALALAGHNVTLIDAAEKAVEAANYYAGKMNAKINAVCFDRLGESAISGNKYDVIVAKDLIEHVVDDEQLFKSFFSKLRPGGILIVSTQNALSVNYCLEGGIRKIIHPKTIWMGWDRTHLRFYTPNRLLTLSENAGFSCNHFNSGYIFPYKLIARAFPWFDCSKDSLFFRLDLFLMRLPFLRKFGWNLMIVCAKK